MAQWVRVLAPQEEGCDTGRLFIMVYNGNLVGPLTLTVTERLTVEHSIPVFMTYVCRCWGSNAKPSYCGANTLIYCATVKVN